MVKVKTVTWSFEQRWTNSEAASSGQAVKEVEDSGEEDDKNGG